MAQQVAVLGTGLLGAGFVRGFRKRGNNVNVWNRTAEKAKALESTGAKAFATPAEAVRGAKFVHLVLTDDTVVDSVLEAARSGIAADAIIIDHSTVSPIPTAARFTRLRELGLTYVSAPVFMGPANAEEATGTILVSCSDAEWAKVSDHIKPMTGAVHYQGSERLDKASALKLCGNNAAFMMAGLIADLMHVQIGMGLDPKDVLFVTEKCLPVSFVAQWAASVSLAGNFKPASFELSMARKDVRLLQDTAAQTKSPLVLVPAIAAKMDEKIKEGCGDSEFLVLNSELAERYKKSGLAAKYEQKK